MSTLRTLHTVRLTAPSLIRSHRGILLQRWLWTLLACLLPLTAQGADGEDTLKRTRMRQGVWIGGGVTAGKLQLVSDSAIATTELSQMSIFSLGADLWPDESLGVYGALTVGTGADIVSQQVRAVIGYNTHQLELGGRYRWFFGPKAHAGALIAALGIRGLRQTAQEQRPSILVNSTAVGPELSLAWAQPLSDAVWLRLTGRGALPFFYRESPTDSGDPQSYLQLGGRLELVWWALGDWGLQITADYLRQDLSFLGEGTRSVGVEGAETTDQLFSGQLQIRRAF